MNKIMKKIIFILLLSFIFLYPIPYTLPTYAASCVTDGCPAKNTTCRRQPSGDYACAQVDPTKPADLFGSVVPPVSIIKFGFGAEGIGNFFTNLITVIYAISMVVLIFMLLWGAFDWITSEGDKEKLDKARGKIINAIIGVVILAAAFAIIQVLGVFTGFSFFVGQKDGT